jgi:excisionase family DNA binding protein
MDAQVTDAVQRGVHPTALAAMLHLTVDSVRWRIRVLGLSLRDGWSSSLEVAALLGVSWRSVNRWRRDGYLRVTRPGRRWTRVTDADLRAFVGTWAGVLFDADGVRDPGLRSLAETASLASRRRAADAG